MDIPGLFFSALIPLISRQIPNQSSLYDLISPYGYPGILTTRALEREEINFLLIDFSNDALGAGYVSTFIRLNPYLNNWKVKNLNNCVQVFHGYTVSVDLSVSIHDVRSKYSLNHKRGLMKCKNRYFANINNYNFYDEFINIYYQTMKRRGAKPYYFYPKDYFYSLKDLAYSNLLFVSIHNYENNSLAAAGLFSFFGDVMQFLFGATADTEIIFSPSKVLIDTAIQIGFDLKASKLHLGGGLGASNEDGLFRFKKGFGNILLPYSTLRFIHQPDIYNFLSSQVIRLDNSCDSFFPLYRFKNC